MDEMKANTVKMSEEEGDRALAEIVKCKETTGMGPAGSNRAR